MPFDANEQRKLAKAMTTKDTMNKPITVVSTQSGNEAEINKEINNLGDVGSKQDTKSEQEEYQFVEVGHPADVHSDPPLAELVTPGHIPINKMSPHDLDDFMHSSVVARPVRLPNRLTVRCKDPNWRPRWVEFKSEDGRRFNDCCNMGFRIAKKEEIIGLSSSLRITPEGIKDNDLVLMVIPTETINGYLKHNALESLRKVSRKSVTNQANREGNAAMREGLNSLGLNPKLARRAQEEMYIYDPQG